MTSTGEAWAFWILATVAVVTALVLLLARKAVHAAFGMAASMVALGAIFLAQQAPFLGVVHVFVYSGAVMMLFLFVVMLVGVDHADSLVETLPGQRFWSTVLALGLAALLMTGIGRVNYTGTADLSAVNADPGNVPAMAGLIFGRYVWVFEITSLLLITAAMAGMVLAQRQRLTPKATQREWSERRIRSNTHVAGLPNPGVYARHNAVDTPALQPDGSISALSINRTLKARGQVASPVEHVEAEERIQREITEGRTR
ncbi:NADH-quinone oxidoreductase subunit J [Kribbia dieselivorans]|uniref:NADH-quinone oxidoreductase subunit J n=1 Tax=Kribbia dieselivorans TaxID=331526 RepID=UPI0008385DAF|nr:NADH-quinone oxidoreductase subunit J [Kribbia dieselivorans]